MQGRAAATAAMPSIRSLIADIESERESERFIPCDGVQLLGNAGHIDALIDIATEVSVTGVVDLDRLKAVADSLVDSR